MPAFFPDRIVLAIIESEEGRMDAALREIDKTLEQDPALWPLLVKTRIYLDKEDLLSARKTLSTIREEDRAVFPARLLSALLFASEGQAEQARRSMDVEVEKFGKAVLFFTLQIAEFHAVLGDNGRALEALELAVRNGDERVEWFLRAPLLAGIRADPRFKQIVESADSRRRRRNAAGSSGTMR
jgi:hypothetical protein